MPEPAAHDPITGEPLTDLVWASCVSCGASALSTPSRAAEARCGPCHVEDAKSATLPDTVPVQVVQEAMRLISAPPVTPAEPVRLVDVDARPVAAMEKVAREYGWTVRTAGTYGHGVEMIGVWMDGHGYRAAAFWSRKYGEQAWKADGTLIMGTPPFTYLNHTDLKQWLKDESQTSVIIQRARVRKMPLHTCEPPDKKTSRKKPAEHGG